MARLNQTASLDRLLKQSSLKRLISESSEIQQLDRLIKQQLPLSLKPQCQVMNLHDGTLVIGVNSSVWATQLRYQIPVLLHTLTALSNTEAGKNIPPIKNIRPKVVRFQVGLKSKPPRPMKRLSRKNAHLIAETAETESDPRLREALLKLSKNT